MEDPLPDLTDREPVDPDARATVTDFLDYTEFFPADLFRSLTLIGKLDESYQQDTQNIHQLTRTYGRLPTLPITERSNAQILRENISNDLDHALRAREASFAEASRLCSLADNLYNRLVTIKAKLEAQPKPPLKDPTPVPQPRSPQFSRTRKFDNDRMPRITLHFDSSDKKNIDPATHKHRTRRIIVPGEVLPPIDPNSPA